MPVALDRPALTPRQREVLDYIVSFRLDNGFSPTTREISYRFGYTSQNSAWGFLKALRRKGYVRWTVGKSRTLVVL